MITREHLEGASMLVAALASIVVLGLVALVAWEWLKDQIHFRGGRSRWAEEGGSNERLIAIGAAITTGRWVRSIWIRGGWRIIVSRDGTSGDEDWRRFLHAKSAIAQADVHMWGQLREKEEKS